MSVDAVNDGDGGVDVTLTNLGGKNEGLKSLQKAEEAKSTNTSATTTKKSDNNEISTSTEKEDSTIHLEFLIPHKINISIPTSLAGHLLKNHSKKLQNIERAIELLENVVKALQLDKPRMGRPPKEKHGNERLEVDTTS